MVAGTGAGRLAWAPVVVMGVLLAAGVVLQPAAVFDPPWLFAPLNLLFLTVIPLTAALLAIPAYRRTGVGAVLALGTGMVTMAVGCGVLPAVLLYVVGQNAVVTIHNSAVLLAAAANFAAAVGSVYVVSLGPSRGRHVVVMYSVAAVAIGVLLALTLADEIPAFWTADGGATELRQLVLGLAVALLVLSASIWWQQSVRERGVRFLNWYVPGLALFALGLVAIMMQARVGDLVGWIGRVGQYAGAAYMLAAVVNERLQFRARHPGRTLGVSLLRSAVPLRPLLESTLDAVVALGPDCRVVYWNEAAARLFGHDPGDVFDADPADLLLAAGPSPSRERLKELLANPGHSSAAPSALLELVDLSGRRFPAEIRTFGRERGGRFLVCVISDISERVRAHEELEQRVMERTAELERANLQLARANEAKDEFLGLVSHELKTPITTILAAATILERNVPPDEVDGVIADIVADAHRLTGVIDNLLVLSRIETGHAAPGEPVPMDRLLARVLTRMRREYPDRTVDVSTTPGVIVEAGEEQLEIVVRNYVANALKYSPCDAPVWVKLTTEGDRAVVAVLDSGVGIDPMEASRLFEPFYRSASMSRTPGVGIGLTVCRRIVESLGGSVSASVRLDGPGSVFTFTLPLAAVDSEAGRAALPAGEPVAGE